MNCNECDRENKINFIVPDFLNVAECVYFLDTFRNHFEIFKDNINLLGFSGMFPGNTWNERNKRFDVYKYDIDNIKNLRKKYSALNISLFIFFDKEDVSSEDLEDEYANEVISIFDDKKNYVICKSKKLEDYIRENFKNINIIEEYNNEGVIKDYMIVNPDLNLNEKLFDVNGKSNLILFPDCNMIPNKRWMFKHCKRESKLNKINPKYDKYYSNKSLGSFYEIKKDKNYLSYEKLLKYLEKGINTFMLSGFGVYNVAMYENIVDYLFKEEYKKDQRLNLYEFIKILIEQEELAIYNYEL